jgi:hypothetical protein
MGCLHHGQNNRLVVLAGHLAHRSHRVDPRQNPFDLLDHDRSPSLVCRPRRWQQPYREINQPVKSKVHTDDTDVTRTHCQPLTCGEGVDRCARPRIGGHPASGVLSKSTATLHLSLLTGEDT